MTELLAYANGPIFDGSVLHHGKIAVFEDDKFVALRPASDLPPEARVTDLATDILMPGFVDLQVNGGGGVMLGAAPSVDTVRQIAGAHFALGTTHVLPTLITDTPEVTVATIRAVSEAVKEHVPGVAGLHLEGPYLSHAKKGAHEGRLIRQMSETDLENLISAKVDLPSVMVTVAPEAVSLGQVAALAEAGVIVSLGHTNASFETCIEYIEAGATCVTHLFNAMSQLGSREPGLVGAALHSVAVHIGLIADGIHVHPAALGTAWRSKSGAPFYLVSDAMAVAGVADTRFLLGEREITRHKGRLTLADGTLAGADLTLAQAVKTLVNEVGVPLEAALTAATTTPARVIDVQSGLVPGITTRADLIRLAADLSMATPLASDLTG